MKKGQKAILIRVWQYIRRYRLQLLLSVLLSSTVVALTLYAPVLVGQGIDYVVEQGKVDFAAIYRILIRLVVVAMATALCQWVMNLLNNRISYRVVADIRFPGCSSSR